MHRFAQSASKLSNQILLALHGRMDNPPMVIRHCLPRLCSSYQGIEEVGKGLFTRCGMSDRYIYIKFNATGLGDRWATSL